MTAYRCLILSSEGRSDWRTVEALSERAAVAQLMADGVTPIDVRSGAPSLAERLNRPVRFGSRLGLSEKSLLLTQLAMLVRSGLAVDKALDLLRDQAPRAGQREVLSQALAKVRSGHGLSRALDEAGVFPSYVIGVLRSAERSGRLGDALTTLAERMNAAASTRRQLVTALSYPAAILAATMIALLLVLLVVVPQFEPVFEGEEARLPALTRWVLSLSHVASDRGMLLLALIAAIPVSLWLLIRSAAGSALVQRYRRRIPGLKLRDQYLAAQLAGMLSTLLANGVPVVAAIPLARETTSSIRWRQHLGEVERRVREGSSLSRALAAGDLFPSTAIRLLEVGERSGQLAATCGHASLVLGEAARARIDRAVALANPIAIVTLGGVVAMLVAGVMLGIFAMGDFAG